MFKVGVTINDLTNENEMKSVSTQPILKCSLNGYPVEALIDTGSMKTIISKSVFEKAVVTTDPSSVLRNSDSNSKQCYSITGQPLKSLGEFSGRLQFSGSKYVYVGNFIVCDDMLQPLQCILGWDFLTSHKLQLQVNESGYFMSGPHGITPIAPQVTQFRHNSASSKPLFTQSTHLGPVPVKLVSSIIIPAKTEIVAKANIPRSSRNKLGMLTPVFDDKEGVFAAYILCAADNRCVPVRLLNSSAESIEVHSGQHVADFCPVFETFPSPLTDVIGGVVSDETDMCAELESVLSPELSQENRAALLATLMKYTDVFEHTLGHSDVVKHSIDTGNAQPIRQSPRRLPYAYRKEVDTQIEEMLGQGVIQPSTSPWASPIVLVKKKDGSFRFCVDYRKLNAITQREARPLPRVDDLLDALQGYNLFSTLDLRSGYWQLSMDPGDREKTAFITPNGLWEFLRVPYGLSGAPACFDRAIKIAMSGLNYDTCLCYFDDLIVPSTNIKQHCERLESVLDRLRSYNLRVKASKCTFGATKVVYLGHTVSAQGIHTDPKKIEAVRTLTAPQNIEQVRSFLGLAGYYRKFIPNFATIASPLVTLTMKGSSFVWGESQMKAFELLRKHLCSAPILAYPSFDKPFVLQTDASNTGVGAVLAQIDNHGNEQVIAYASRTLSPREKNYTTMEKEALAVVFATKHFRVYLLGNKFKLITDNSALTWLHSLEPKGRIARWVMDLQEFEFEVTHRPGKENSNADALSRLPSTSNAVETGPLQPRECDYNFLVTLAPQQTLHDAQMQDPAISTVIELKEQRMPKPPLFVWVKDPTLRTFWYCWNEFYISDGLLVRSVEGRNKIIKRAVVLPTSLIPKVLESLHAGPSGGHMGITRTMHRIKERFFWPKMQETVQNYVQNCPQCMQSKTAKGQGKAPLKPIVVSEPFVFWAMDYMGPLPETCRGNKHLLVIGDHFSKWCEAFPTKDQKATTVAPILVSKLFSRFGPPDVLHSDQGTNFESNLMKDICNMMGIHKSRTTAYHPQGDGQVERQNRTLQEILSTFVADHPGDWDLFVDLAVYAYNTSRHESTGFSPYEIVFGRTPRMPIEVDLDVPLRNPSSQSDYTKSVRNVVKEVTSLARTNLETARKKQASSYDKNRGTWTPFQPGSSVWMRRPKKWKFGRKWVGPYVVLSRSGVNYKLRSKMGKTLVSHHDQLKSCPVPASEGQPYCPVPEIPDVYVSEPQAVENARMIRPQNLRQVVNPPIRFGEYVTH